MKKKFLAISLISALILSCFAFVMGLMPEKAMAEESDTPAADPTVNFEVAGASIRKIAPMGLRFEVKINADAANAATELGMYLCPTGRLTGGKFSDEQLKNNVMEDTAEYATADKYIKKVPIKADELTADPENQDKMILRLSLVNLVPSSLDKQFSAMAYIKFGENETTSGTIERSVAYVARRTLADPDSELSDDGDDRKFVEAIVANSNDFCITTDGVSVDTAVKRNDKFTHKITLGAEGTKDIELSLDKTFEKDVICRIKLFAKADVNAANIKINGQDVDTNNFIEITLDDIQVVNNKVSLHITGDAEGDKLWIDDIRAEGMKSLGTDGIKLSATGGAADISTLTRHTDTNTVEYNAGGWQQDNVGFTHGKAIPADEYLVIKFRYYSDMEDNYFHPNVYSDEGLWIRGLDYYDYAKADGTSVASCHEKDYFSTFDENYLDYTLYMHGDDDSSYEGTKVAVPYGSLHGTKGVTTEANTWYYAVAPIAGNYQKISSYNSYLHIEIADIYSVKGDIKAKLFVSKNYPKHLITPGAMRIETRQTVNLEADVIASSLGMKAGDFGYALAGSSTLVTVDAAGNVTAGADIGECDITISAAGQESVNLHITVIEGPKPFEGTGITRLSLDDLSVNHEDVSLKKLPYNRREYSAPGNAWREGQISIGETSNTSLDGKYLVIKFRYFDDMYFDADTYSYEGLWPMGYETGANDSPRAYFAIFDEDYLDYTIYKHEGDTPYGSYHGTKGLTTEPQTWYFAVAPRTGGWNSMSSCYNGAHLEIEGFYAVTSTKKEELFKKGNYPKVMCAPAEVVISKGETRDLNVPADSLSITAEELTYSSDNEEVATVSGGVVTAVGAGTCTITVTLNDSSISKEVVVNVDDGTNLSLVRLYAIGNGTMTDTDEGYKYYDSNGKYWEGSMIGITDVPSDKYMVLKFKYIAQSEANDFYMYKGDGQDLPEYRKGAESTKYDFAFIFECDETTKTYTDMTNYTNGVPTGKPKEMNGVNWYYWVSPNKGAYRGFTSDQPLKCVIGNVYAYTAEERQATFGIAASGEDSGIVELGLDCLSVKGKAGEMGQITDTQADGITCKCYNSLGNKYDNSMIGIANAYSDRYIVFKFQYIEMQANTIFYSYKGDGQSWSEYRTGAESDRYDYAFLFEYDEEANKYKDVTNYTNGVPQGVPTLTSGKWYYWVSANKGTYKGYTSDQILKCNISNVYAYTAEARQATFGIEVKG